MEAKKRSAASAVLVWQHTGVPSGVYLYLVPGTTDVVTGKVMVVK